MDKDGPETMREAVAREVRKFANTPEAATLTATQFILNRDDAIAQAAIRTVLERLREPTSDAIQAGVEAYWPLSEFVEGPLTNGERARRGYLAMLDAAAREVG